MAAEWYALNVLNGMVAREEAIQCARGCFLVLALQHGVLFQKSSISFRVARKLALWCATQARGIRRHALNLKTIFTRPGEHI